MFLSLESSLTTSQVLGYDLIIKNKYLASLSGLDAYWMVCGRGERNHFSLRKRDFNINSISGQLLVQYAQFSAQRWRIKS